MDRWELKIAHMTSEVGPHTVTTVRSEHSFERSYNEEADMWEFWLVGGDAWEGAFANVMYYTIRNITPPDADPKNGKQPHNEEDESPAQEAAPALLERKEKRFGRGNVELRLSMLTDKRPS